MKKAIVIGASSGIGRELAKILVQNEYQVGITGRRENLLEELCSEKPESYFVQSFDLQDTASVATNLDALYERMGELDLVIISAGLSCSNTDFDYYAESETLSVNVLAFTLICNWALRIFREQKRGHLVGITSVAGARGWRISSAYSASKAFQINYLEGLRNYVAFLKIPVTITNIISGYVDTRMKGNDYVLWVAPPEVAARQIFRSIQKKKKIAYTYRRWRFGYFLFRHLPNKLVEIS